MTELSPAQQEIARKNERAILHALAVVSQKRVADLSGISETRLSRLKERWRFGKVLRGFGCAGFEVSAC